MLMKKQHKQMILTVIATAVVASWATIVFFHLNQPQELRQKAAVPTGTEKIVLSPSGHTYIIGQPLSIVLSANLTNTPVDGIQVVATIAGTLPSNLSFQMASISGMTCVRHLFTTTPTGKRLELACLTNNPQTPLTTLGLVTLGTFTGKITRAGSMTISYDTKLTKIPKNQTAQDIVNIPQTATYIFPEVPRITR